MNVTCIIKNVKNLVFVLPMLSLLSCGGTVSDNWPGIGELRIENDGARLSKNSFGLSSELILTGLTSDVSFSITTQCKRRAKVDGELSFEKYLYSKTVNYQMDEEIIFSVPVINHLDERVLIYPDLFEQCNFIVDAKNSVGSTDKEGLYEVKFNYLDSDHHLVLDDHEVTKTFREGLYESHSKLKALYAGDIEHPVPPSNPTIIAKAIPDPRISGAKLLCYTNDFQESELNIDIDLYNDDVEVLSFYKTNQLHQATENHPLENCIFHAVDNNGTVVSSKPFDLVRDYGMFNSALRYDDLQVLPDLTLKPLEFTSKNAAEVPEFPSELLNMRYRNTTNEKKLVLLGSRSTFSENQGVFLFKKQTAENISGDEVLFEKSCRSEGPFYRHRYFKLERSEIPVQFIWKSDHMEYIGDRVFLAVPPQGSGILSLHLEVDHSVFNFYDASIYDGVIIAPPSDLDSLQVAFASPNEFRINIIKPNALDEIFFEGVRHSSLPQGFRTKADEQLSSQSAFGIVMFNRHQDTSKKLTVREYRDSESERNCFKNRLPNVNFNSGDGRVGVHPD